MTSELLCSKCNSIGVVFACGLPGQRVTSRDLHELLDAGKIPCSRYFVVPDLIGFRFENADRALAEHC